MPGKKWLEALANYAEKAVQGDRYAIRFFADYLIGRPLERQIVAHGRMSARQQELLEYMAELYRSIAEEPPASEAAAEWAGPAWPIGLGRFVQIQK